MDEARHGVGMMAEGSLEEESMELEEMRRGR